MSKLLIVRRFFLCSFFVSVISLLLFSGLTFSDQVIKVGFIPGGGDDAAFEQKAFETAKVEYKALDINDYKLDRLLKYDVIAIGVIAYDKNEDLKANFQVVKEYAKSGGYIVTVDFQQDATWKPEYFPYPLQLFDDDVEENVGVEIIDHPIWNNPNKIIKEHFVGWGALDFAADLAHEAKTSWKSLLNSNNWPVVMIAGTGSGYAVFSSLQITQSLGRTGNQKVAEVLQNFLFWRGPLAVNPKSKMTSTWARLKLAG